MAISYIGSAESAGTTAVTMPSHQAGDLFIYLELLPSGFYNPPTGYLQLMQLGSSATGNTFLVYAKFANSNAESAPSASGRSGYRAISVYRGVGAIGDVSGRHEASAINARFPSLNFYEADSGSWVVGLMGSNSGGQGTGAPSGMTNRQEGQYNPGANYTGALHDTNGTVSSWAATDGTNGTDAQRYYAATVQLLPSDPFGGCPVLESVTNTTANAALTINVAMPSTVNAGDLLLIVASTETTTDFSGTDPTGWTKYVRSATQDILALYAKVADGTEGGTTVGVSLASSTTDWTAHCLRFSNWEGTLAGGLAVSAGATGIDVTPETLSPGWGAVPITYGVAWGTSSGSLEIDEPTRSYMSVAARTSEGNRPRSTVGLSRRADDSSVTPIQFLVNSASATCRTFTFAVLGKQDAGNGLFWGF